MRAAPRAMRAAARAAIAGVGAAACLAFAAPAAQAVVESAQAWNDPQTTYTINGDTLTIQSSDPIVLEFVRGSELRAACYPARTSHMSRDFVVRWGEHATSVTFHYPQAIPAPGECELIWVSGGAHPLPVATEFSVAPFTSYWQRQSAWVLPPGPFLARAELSGEWMGIEAILPMQYLSQYGFSTALPPAHVLVRIANARFRKGRLPLGLQGLALRYTRTVAGVKVPGVPYVIGRGSTTKRLEMVVIGMDGKRYAYRTKVGRYVGGKFGLV
jgi:hypothetical protein